MYLYFLFIFLFSGMDLKKTHTRKTCLWYQCLKNLFDYSINILITSTKANEIQSMSLFLFTFYIHMHDNKYLFGNCIDTYFSNKCHFMK
jgi:hypothetical protein